MSCKRNDFVLTFKDGKDDDDSLQVIDELEKIDDDCDKHGIQFVKIDDRSAAKEHGVKDVEYNKFKAFAQIPEIFLFLLLAANNHFL